MATVPRKTVPGVKVRPISPVFDQRKAPIGAFGTTGLTELGAAGLRTGLGLVDVAINEAADENDREAKEADNTYSQRVRELLWGENGYYSKRQKEAMDSHDGVVTSILEVQSEIAVEMKSERARRMFMTSTNTANKANFNKMGSHRITEQRASQIQVSEARKAEAADDAALAYTDGLLTGTPGNPTVTENAVATIRSEVEAQLKLAGHARGTEEGEIIFENEFGKAVTALYSGMIDGALKHQQVDVAIQLLDKFEGQMDPAVVANLRNKIKNPKLVQDATLKHDGYMQLSVAVDGKPGKTNKEILAQAKRDLKGQPFLRDAVVTMLEATFASNRRFRAESIAKVHSEWSRKISGGEMTFDELIQANPDEAQVIFSDPRVVDLLQKAQRLKTEKLGFAVATDGKERARVLRLNDDEFAALDVDTLKSVLTRTEYDDLIEKQRALKARIASKGEKKGPFNNARAALQRLSPQLKWNTKDEMSDETNPLVKSLDRWVQDFLDDKKVPTQPQINEEVTRMLLNVRVDPPGWWKFNVYRRLAGRKEEMTPEERAIATVPLSDIPPGLLSDIKAAIKSRGIEETDDLIEEIAGSQAMGDRSRQERLLRQNPRKAIISLP